MKVMNSYISLPVHERADVVMDQLRNIFKFMPNTGVVIHLSKNFQGDTRPITDFASNGGNDGRVIINSERLATGWANMVQSHVSNYDHLSERCNIRPANFILHASNDMFVKEGAEAYVDDALATRKLGVQQMLAPENLQWTPRLRAIHDPMLKDMMDYLGLKDVMCSQVEGIFFDGDVFGWICSIIKRSFDHTKIAQYTTKNSDDHTNAFYAREEIYFSTIASKLMGDDVRFKVAYPYLFNEVWLGGEITTGIVDDIRVGTLPDDKCFERRLFNPPVRLNDPKHLYAVKRVPRDINNPLRRFIGSL